MTTSQPIEGSSKSSFTSERSILSSNQKNPGKYTKDPSDFILKTEWVLTYKSTAFLNEKQWCYCFSTINFNGFSLPQYQYQSLAFKLHFEHATLVTEIKHSYVKAHNVYIACWTMWVVIRGDACAPRIPPY